MSTPLTEHNLEIWMSLLTQSWKQQDAVVAAAKRVDAAAEECKQHLRSLYASLLALEARVRQAAPYQLPEREKKP